MEVHGEVPGLLSVAMAIGTPALRNQATGGGCVWRKV
jgi:CO/xanthine dehydrogenase FAD-binding subunit